MLAIWTDDMVLLMNDKAHFHVSGYINKQKFHYWLESNPQQLHEHPFTVNVLHCGCCVANFGVIGPYFFKRADIQ